jgi:hypothetical protein
MAAATVRAAAHEYAAALDDFAADVLMAALILRSVGEVKFAAPRVERDLAAILSNAVVDTRRKWKLPELGHLILENARNFEQKAQELAAEGVKSND